MITESINVFYGQVSPFDAHRLHVEEEGNRATEESIAPGWSRDCRRIVCDDAQTVAGF